MKKIIKYLTFLMAWCTSTVMDAQITSAEVFSNAKAYLNYEWTATAENIWNQASCGGKSVNTPDWVTAGDHTAMAYCWGGNSTLSQFTAYLPEGKSAGDNNTSVGYGAEPECSIGVDCSGFVSRCYGLSTHYSTTVLNVNALFGHYSGYEELHDGDFINNPGSHTRLVTKINANGTITVTESGSGVSNVGASGLWRVFTWTYDLSQLAQYNPQYYLNMTSADAALDCTVAVELSCGVSYHGNSSSADSNISFYGCNSWTETGPDRVHTITPETDGILVATISNFSGDLDVYILGSCDPSDCLGIVTSNDVTFTDAQAGHTYYVVVDSDDGSESSYDLVVECFTSEDISVTNAAVVPASVNPGGEIEVSADQNYSGLQTDADLPVFTLEYYLSVDCTWSFDDILLGVDSSDLGYNQPTISETATLAIPAQTTAGTYYILFTADTGGALSEFDENNNTNCVLIEIINPSAVMDVDFQKHILLYPNPTREVINISTTNDEAIHQLVLYNSLGNWVKTIEGNRLDKLEIRELPAGYYLLKIIGVENRQAVFRVVKN